MIPDRRATHRDEIRSEFNDIVLSCSCGHETNLGAWPSVDDLVEARRKHLTLPLPPAGRIEQDKGWQLENSKEVVHRVHLEARCAGQPCPIHNMSDHAMRHFPQHWRDDRGIMERICPHGIGHPDPDSPWPRGSAEWVHGCDGCCR